MRKFQCLLLVLKQSNIRDYIICMTVHLSILIVTYNTFISNS